MKPEHVANMPPGATLPRKLHIDMGFYQAQTLPEPHPPGATLPHKLHIDMGFYHSALGVGAGILGSSHLLYLKGLLWEAWGGTLLEKGHRCRDLD